MPRVLISTNHLVNLGGSELVTVELIEAFLNLHWDVDVLTYHYGGQIQEEIEKIKNLGNLRVFCESGHESIDSYDLFWVQHSIIDQKILRMLSTTGYFGNVVFNHMSSFLPMEQPVDSTIENELADLILAVSLECRDALRDNGISENKISLFSNPAPRCFLDKNLVLSPDLRRIAVVSNHPPKELIDAIKILEGMGRQCVLIGNTGIQTRVTPDLLASYDVVVSIGKTVQYALVMGIPVYVYDYFGGPGYLSENNLEAEAYYNFSGRNKRRKLSAEKIVGELIKQYDEARVFVSGFRESFSNRWDLPSTLQKILNNLPKKKLKKITAKQARFIESYLNKLRAMFVHDMSSSARYSYPKWLKEREPSSARILALQTMLKANPDVGTLGVAVVLQSDANVQDIVVTLQSLGLQDRPVDGVWLIGQNIQIDELDEGIEILRTDAPWPRALFDRIKQGNVPDYLWILNAGEQLLPHATLTVGEYRLRQPDPLVWYADEAVWNKDGSERPMLKPDFNMDLLRSYPYVGRNLVISTAAIQAVGGLDERVGDLAPIDLVWKLVEAVGPSVVGHIPEVLHLNKTSLMEWTRDTETMVWAPVVTQAHFVRIGKEAEVQPGSDLGLWHVQHPLPVQPLVSIIIPTRDQFPVLQACIEGLMAHTVYPYYELLIIDNGSVEPRAVAFLEGLENMNNEQVRVFRWPHAFNFAAMNNFAVKQARGDVFLFLNNDIQFSNNTRQDWLERLLRHVLRPEVGGVGSRLDLPDGRVDQCGLVLGMDNSVGKAFHGMASESHGYMNRLIAQQNISALSASCLMMRRQVFEELGGFDEETFPVYYADADLSMKATQAGYLLVLEPDTGLLHMGGASRLMTEKFGLEVYPDEDQCDSLYARWLPQLARDPNYHPAFGKYSPGFSLSPDAARINEPLPGRPLPVVMVVHNDYYGCGYYRILHPFKAMEKELRLEGGLKLGDFHFTDVARIQPDVIVLQGAWANENILTQIRRYKEITGAKVVLEFDDYLPNIPTRSIHRKQYQGRIKYMRRAIEAVDWLVVSTPKLAQEYASFHHDIRVAKNGLLPEWWKGLESKRRTGKKMRVGWAGGSSHTGDLAEIKWVVKELQDEVEWVFMGMKPEGVDCEYHKGAPIDRYPAKLASLNLDLAVVPLEINQFNRCKSNLRLLELGACGVPIICTDIEPYQCDLPVTRVPNKHLAWVDAIRSHLANPDDLARAGDELREAILRDWMLEGEFLDQWEYAWLGVNKNQ